MKLGEDKAELFCSAVSCSAYADRPVARQLFLQGEGIAWDFSGELGYYTERERGGAEGQNLN